ncbi:hypothetical protein [Acidipila sp. EB88]|uniref:hypothetical protein n=1 Tax=Acidipila sp. EB88 TaxID=2305226 RepID=UPI003514CA18
MPVEQELLGAGVRARETTLLHRAEVSNGWAPEPVREHRSRDGRVFLIRRCATAAELDACVALQQETWGYPDREVVPRNIYVLAQSLGGHVFGAWDAAGTLAGFAMAMAAHAPQSDLAAGRWMRGAEQGREQADPAADMLPGRMRGDSRNAGAVDERAGSKDAVQPECYLHSHMLAVRAADRNTGLGVALKLAQREDALRLGIRTMRWTFDPLVAKNAFLNLERLGVTVRRYIANFYGPLDSEQQGGLPSDRLLAEWSLASERVTQRIAGRSQAVTPVEEVELPGEIVRWRAEGGRDAAEAQRALRERLEAAFARGLVMEGFTPTPGGGGRYRLYAEGALHNI